MAEVLQFVFALIGAAIYRRRWTRVAFRVATLAFASFTIGHLVAFQTGSFVLFLSTFGALLTMFMAEGEVGSGWLAVLAAATFALIVGLGIRTGL